MQPSNILLVAQRIPISLLELNTFGHAVCALLIYLVWWEKPFEVDHPTILRSHELWEHFALFWTETQPTLSMIQMDRKFKQLLLRDKEFQKLDEVGSFATSSETFYVLAGRVEIHSLHTFVFHSTLVLSSWVPLAASNASGSLRTRQCFEKPR